MDAPEVRFAVDSPLEEGGFELMVPPRTERKWEGAGTARVAAAAALRICRVEALPGRSRLPRRDRQALLQRAASTAPPGGRGAHHRRDNRDLSSRQTGRQPLPQPAPASADHRPRAYALLPPALSRLDPRAHPP